MQTVQNFRIADQGLTVSKVLTRLEALGFGDISSTTDIVIIEADHSRVYDSVVKWALKKSLDTPFEAAIDSVVNQVYNMQCIGYEIGQDDCIDDYLVRIYVDDSNAETLRDAGAMLKGYVMK